jgi:hypothetical protein
MILTAPFLRMLIEKKQISIMKLFDVDSDDDVICRELNDITTLHRASLKAVEVNIDNLFSTTSSNEKNAAGLGGSLFASSPCQTPNQSTMFLDIVDMTDNPCCGYHYILCLVCPDSRRGHAISLKSLLHCDIISAVTHLLNTMKLKPVVICYDWAAQSELLILFQSQFPHVKVIKAEKSPLIKQEKALFCKMLDHWLLLLRNNNNWLYGVHIIQAVTNTMPL